MIVPIQPSLRANNQPANGRTHTIQVYGFVIAPETGEIIRAIGIDEFGHPASVDLEGLWFEDGVPISYWNQPNV